MANHARGLWGYSGATADGRALTIQATGVGGPSVAVVLTELASLGVRRAIRIGTCRALAPDLEPGELLAAAAAIGTDGTSRALGVELPVDADRALTEALTSGPAEIRTATVASADLYYDPSGSERDRDRLAVGARAVDLGTASALALGTRPGLAIASALVVTRSADGRALGDEEVEAASIELARAGAAALASRAPPGGRSASGFGGRQAALIGGDRGRVGDLAAQARELAARSSRRSSISSSRPESDRRRRSRRSTSAAAGTPTALIALRCAWAARSPAPSARDSVWLKTGLSSSACARSPSASSPLALIPLRSSGSLTGPPSGVVAADSGQPSPGSRNLQEVGRLLPIVWRGVKSGVVSRFDPTD